MSAAASPTLKLAVALAATWLVLAGPASMAGGLNAVEGLSYAAILCFVPHLLSVAVLFVLESPVASGKQGHPFTSLLLTTSLRLVVVLLGTIVICWHRPDLRGLTFVAWLLPCYIVALAVETQLLIAKVGGTPRPESVNGTSATGAAIRS